MWPNSIAPQTETDKLAELFTAADGSIGGTNQQSDLFQTITAR